MTVTSSSTPSTTAAASAPAPGTSVPLQAAPMGKPVSGRTWKKAEKARFSTVRYKGTKVLSSSWDEKVLKRAKLKEMKALQSEIKSRRQAERDAKRQAREDKEKRRKENELKSASVQVISRTHRMKTMSKKQLRNIRKTIVNKQGVVEYVPIYGSKDGWLLHIRDVWLKQANAKLANAKLANAFQGAEASRRVHSPPLLKASKLDPHPFPLCLSSTDTFDTEYKQPLQSIMVRITNLLTIASVYVGSASWLIPGANALIPKLFGINYNARIGPDWAEDVKKCKSAHEIKLDMEVLAKVTNIVRLYSLTDCDQGALVIPAAINAGMSVSVGLWVSQDDTVFQAEKKKLQELIKPERKIFRDDWIFDIHVGSEAIYRKEVTVAKNIEYLKEIKAICTENNNTASIPVTIADIGDTYLEHEELIDAVDIVSANGFPFWEKTEIAVAAEHFRVRMEPLFKLARSKNKEVFISETGWASDGVSTKSSAASPASALKYFKDFYSMANANNWKYFYFEAFDEDWKVMKGAAAENDTVEAHFGLFYANRTLKEVFQTLSVAESADATLEGSSTMATSTSTGASTSNGAMTSTAASAGSNANGKDKCST